MDSSLLDMWGGCSGKTSLLLQYAIALSSASNREVLYLVPSVDVLRQRPPCLPLERDWNASSLNTTPCGWDTPPSVLRRVRIRYVANPRECVDHGRVRRGCVVSNSLK